jgi:hypothetical protein
VAGASKPAVLAAAWLAAYAFDNVGLGGRPCLGGGIRIARPPTRAIEATRREAHRRHRVGRAPFWARPLRPTNERRSHAWLQPLSATIIDKRKKN